MLHLQYKDLELLEKLFVCIKDRNLNKGDVKKAFTTGIDQNLIPIVEKTLNKYLIPIIGEYKIYIAMLLEEFKPWEIHTDYNKGDANPGFAVLIPLETIPTHTVIFNEKCLDDFDLYKEQHLPVINNCENLSSSLLSHCNVDDLKFVTLKAAEEWIRGKIIVWDRQELHSSDNFYNNNIQTKRAIVIFTSRILK